MLEIDLEELYRSFQKEGGEGLTGEEIRERTGWGEKKAQRFLREAVKKGRCRVGRKIVDSVSGVKVPVPAYVFK